MTFKNKGFACKSDKYAVLLAEMDFLAICHLRKWREFLSLSEGPSKIYKVSHIQYTNVYLNGSFIKFESMIHKEAKTIQIKGGAL